MITLKKIYENYSDVLILGVVAAIVGILVGGIDALFGRVLIGISGLREEHIYLLLPFLPLAGALIILIYRHLGKNSIKGMSLLFAVGFEEESKIPKRLVPLIMISTWITHLFGGSAGREGVAVQIGGTVSHTIGRKLKMNNSSRIMLITGMAAGFAGLFQTPIAAVFFAMEVLTAGALELNALFPCLIAAFTASYTSHLLGLEKFNMNLGIALEPSLMLFGKVVLLGIVFGAVGGVFAHVLNDSKAFFSNKIKNPYLKIIMIGALLSIFMLILHQGRYSGLGTNLITLSFTTGQIFWYDWFLKAVLTILTLSAGFQGGEVTPLFSIGACLGAILAILLGIPVPLAAALGYAAVFGSATNTILAPIFIGAEIFGYDYLPYFFIASAVAYVFNGNKSIYSAQKIMDNLN